MLIRVFDTAQGERDIQIPGSVPGGNPVGTPTQLVGVATTTATADPGVGQDVSQGYLVGSVVFNSSNGRWWECYSNALGAAKWVFGGADYINGGTNPPNEVTQFGNGTASLAEEGNIFRSISAGVSPGSTGNDNVLAVFTLPANSFDIAGRGVTITAQGSFGGTTNNKTVKIMVGVAGGTVGSAVTLGSGVTIATTGVVATNGSGWVLSANLFKYGAAGSNTQAGLHTASQCAAAVQALQATSLLTLTEANAQIIVVTGNAATLANDIVLNYVEINAVN